MSDHDDKNLIEELDLDLSDSEIGRISEVIRSSPEIPDEPVRKSRIAAALRNPQLTTHLPAGKAGNLQPMRFLKYIFAAGGVAVILLAVLVSNRRPGLPGTPPTSVAAKLGFGKLPDLTADQGVPEAAMLGAPSKTLAAGPAGDAAVSARGSADSGVATLIIPTTPYPLPPTPSDEVRCLLPEGCPDRPIPPEYLPPKVVYEWQGSSLPEIPAELAVFRALPFAFAREIARTVLDRIGAGNLFQGELSILNFTVRDAEYSWTFDAGNGYVNFWSNEQGPLYALKAESGVEGGAAAGSEEIAPAEPPSAAPDRTQIFPPPSPSQPAPTIPDDEAIRIANDFLSSRGINLARYGAPQVQKYPYWDCRFGPCPLMTEGAARAEGDSGLPKPADQAGGGQAAYPIWYQPEVTVWYPGRIDGRDLADWQGQPQQAIAITIDGGTKQARNGSILILPTLDSSLYPAISTEAALDHALHGGLNPYSETPDIYPPEVEARRLVVRVVLTEAKLTYFQKVSYDGAGSATFYLPVVAFTGTIADQYGNTSLWGTLVSALKSDNFKE